MNQQDNSTGGKAEELSPGEFWELHKEEIEGLVRDILARYPIKPEEARHIAKNKMYEIHSYLGTTEPYDVDYHASIRLRGK